MEKMASVSARQVDDNKQSFTEEDLRKLGSVLTDRVDAKGNQAVSGQGLGNIHHVGASVNLNMNK